MIKYKQHQYSLLFDLICGYKDRGVDYGETKMIFDMFYIVFSRDEGNRDELDMFFEEYLEAGND